MNWKRVLLYVVVMFAATAAAAFPFGLIAGFRGAQGESVPAWLPIGQGVAVSLAMLGVFVSLARRQLEQPWQHALAVGGIAFLLSYPLNVLAMGQAVAVWAQGLVVYGIALAVGVPAGVWLRARSPRATIS